jgi:putative membrane protein
MVAYTYIIHVMRPHVSDAGRVKRSQVTCFSLGVLVLYVAAGSPIHDLSEKYLLSVHMFQHLLFSLVAPPLLLAGMPTWFWQWLVRGAHVRAVARVVLNPILAIGGFNFVLVVTHLPNVVNYALEEHWFHFLVHVTIVTTALMMWWPVITNVPGLPRLTYPYQMAYLFVQSLLPAVIGSFITFSTTPVYSFYEHAPRIWGLSAVEDQQVGALMMKLVGSIILWCFIGVAFFRWYELEQRQSVEPVWRDVEEELQQLGLSGPC